jgi:16S rRNA (cytosine1402-N4)-methyltransferase
MRMDAGRGETAADLLARLTAEELRTLLRDYGEERRAGAIAREIVQARATEPIRRTSQLADIVERVMGPAARRYRLHPATRTFQALRIAVNDEITGLATLVEDAVSALAGGGRLVVIAYHSLEDRAIKTALRRLAFPCTCPPDLPVCGCGRVPRIRTVGSRPVRPTDEEVAANPRARSARLRAAETLNPTPGEPSGDSDGRGRP